MKTTLTIGKIYLTKTGEIFRVDEIGDEEFSFTMFHPKTFEESDYHIEGPTANLPGWIASVSPEEFDITSPSGAADE